MCIRKAESRRTQGTRKIETGEKKADSCFYFNEDVIENAQRTEILGSRRGRKRRSRELTS